MEAKKPSKTWHILTQSTSIVKVRQCDPALAHCDQDSRGQGLLSTMQGDEESRIGRES